MPSSHAGDANKDNMAEVGPPYQQHSVNPAEVLQWSDEYPGSYDSQWHYHNPTGDRDLAHIAPGAESQWPQPAGVPDFGSLPFPHSQQSLQFANASELRHYEQQSRAAQSSMSSPSPSAGAGAFLPHFHDLQDSATAEPSMILAKQNTFPTTTTTRRQNISSGYSPITPEGVQQQQTRQRSQDRRSPSQSHQQRPVALRVPSHSHQGSRGSRSNSMTSSIQLQDEDRLLLHLKEEKALSWKEIAQRFQTELGTSYQIPALQMRYKRLRERMRVWSEGDLAALRQAREYWEAKKWDIISNKMLEFGASEKFSAEACKRKLHEIDNTGANTPLEVSSSAHSSSGRLNANVQFGQQQQQQQQQQWLGPQW